MKGNLESVRIERADNGYTLTTHYKHKPSNINGTSRYIEPDKTVQKRFINC